MPDLDGYEVFIDPMVLHGVLAGVLLGLAGIWLLVLRGALWRAWLREQHGAALTQAAERMGLAPAGSTVRPWIGLVGTAGGDPVRVVLTASWGVPRAVLQGRLTGRVVLTPGDDPAWLADQVRAILGPATP